MKQELKRVKLTRADGQTFHLGDDILLRIVRAAHGRAEMYIQVPENMRISIKENEPDLIQAI
jgi:hypothetical protein